MFHHLVVFLTLSPPLSPVCHSTVHIVFAVFACLGLPLHYEKCEGPAPCFVFLGIELNSVTQTARLPDDKFARIVALLRTWSTKRTCHRQDSQSSNGHLHRACNVVRPGRTFLRRMIDLLARFRTVPSDSPQPRVPSRPPLVALAHWSRREVQVLMRQQQRGRCPQHWFCPILLPHALASQPHHSACIISFSFSARHPPVVLTL